MPVYEFKCTRCGAEAELFVRKVGATVEPPACTTPGCGAATQRKLSTFARHLTEADKIVEAEAKWGKEVDAAMGPEVDIGRYARRYERLAKDLPPSDIPITE